MNAQPQARPTLYRRLATSQSPLARWLRGVRRAIHSFGVPAPRVIVRPLLLCYIAIRAVYHFVVRVFICEPLFKAYCKQYGRGVRTDCHLHWISGKGDIVLGDRVRLDGKSTITFAARFSDHPLLEIGDNCGIGHACTFNIGKRITIGKNTVLSGSILVMDSNGHPVDPELRWAGEAPAPDDVRPVVIGEGVWIGRNCIIFPGVKIGDGSVISAGSVVRSHVPAYSVVAGNPARVMFRVKKPEIGESNVIRRIP